MDLDRLMRPASIAVVGANERPGSYASQTLTNLDAAGYGGEVWGVNPNREHAFGHPCVPTIADLPTAVDAVVVAIPAAGVPDVIEQAGERGCGGAVVFSAGFAEVSAGVGLQEQLVAAAARHELPVCGPNCNGIIATRPRTVLWGDAFVMREPGHVGLVSQSGNVAVNALTTRRGLRFHTIVASGNQAVMSAADYLEFLAGEDGLDAIALYLEDDGGPRLCDGLAACADAGTPVAVLKVGESAAGAHAAAAHSAALAGDQRVFRALVEEAGAVWAADVHELLELAKTMAVRAHSRRRNGLAIMTCSGGDSAQGADEVQRVGLELPPLAPATRERLEELLPAAATAANPLDYTAILWGDRTALSQIVRVLGEDPAIGQVLVFYDQPPDIDGAVEESWRAVRDGIIAGAGMSPVPTMVSSTLPELLDDEAAWRFACAGVPAAAGLRTGVRCAAAMSREPADAERLRAMARAAREARTAAPVEAGRSEWLAEHEAKQLLRAEGIPVVAGRLVAGEVDAHAALREFGGPLALKLSSPTAHHKSELGGVELGLSSPEEVAGAYRRLAAVAAEHGDGVLAEAMAPPGLELLVAASADAVVPAVIVGLGGIWTEVLGDVAIVPLPASAARIERALCSLRGAPLFLGGRGRPPLDVAAAARLAERVGALLLSRRLELVELNPVLLCEAGAVAVDASVRVGAAPRSPARAVPGAASRRACERQAACTT